MATQIGQFYWLHKEDMKKSTLTAQGLPTQYYGHPVVVVGHHTSIATIYPTLCDADAIPDAQERPNDHRWYFPLESLQGHYKGNGSATLQIAFAPQSRLVWAPRWVDIRKRYEIEEIFLRQYIEPDGPFSIHPTILSGQCLELLNAFAVYTPGVMVWLPQSEQIHVNSIIFKQVAYSKIFGRPVVVTEFDRTSGIVTFHLSTTMGNKTFKQINTERASDKFFNRALRDEYLVLVDKKDNSVDYGFKVAVLREDSAPLFKQSFLNVKEKFQIEYIYLGSSVPSRNKDRIILDDASLDLIRAQEALAVAHPLMRPPTAVPDAPPRWEEIEDGKVYLLPDHLPNPTVLHEQTAQNKINIYGRACLVTGKKNGMVRVLPMRTFGEIPITTALPGNKVTDRRERSVYLAIEGYGAKAHDDTPLLNLGLRSPQTLKLTFVIVEKDYYVEYINLRAWSPTPVFLDPSALETIREYRRRHHLDITVISKSTEEALAGNHPFCHALAVSMPYGQENEQHSGPTRVQQTVPNFQGTPRLRHDHYNQHFHQTYGGPPQLPVSIQHQWPHQHTGQATFGSGSMAPGPAQFSRLYAPTPHPHATQGPPYGPFGMPVLNQGGQPPQYSTNISSPYIPPRTTSAGAPFLGNQPSQGGADNRPQLFQERIVNFFWEN
ncbi:hypothetical protein BU16DRAFT_565724 [Lophium mytilinum]|uniref:Uncharacterized protein n=1 Tax=Lophium mytilinum TaxID=390894 RepID=A0A6A6QFL7_9PEZI|nr:hypothetical protein BU16DRAFT_565724 [Lophium mytilinum]